MTALFYVYVAPSEPIDFLKEQKVCLKEKTPECWNRLQREFFYKFRFVETNPNSVWIYHHK